MTDKLFKITATCGNRSRSIAFPIPDEWLEHILELNKAHQDGEEVFTVQGNRNVKIEIAVINFQKEV